METKSGSVVSPELAGMVAQEVERQLGRHREEVGRELAALRERTVDDRATLVVFSGDLDKVLAAFVIAAGAAAAGLQTSMFFTFWGLSAIKKPGAAGGAKSLKERMFGLMTASSSRALDTSKMSFFGMGARMLRSMMKDKQIATLEELMEVARDLDVKMIACTMSMDAMGIGKQELLDGLEYGGVATYMADAARSRVTLFI
ncbi:MAG TPA: DsrE/DsrF/DrsH-like family protein [Vicinamibacteria bacterium]|nr:DsrE/DsrF/DrsH-like family protein [Vicinamibacteria bacterium]